MARPTLCLGEVLVDLICERPVVGFAQAEPFRPHFGGACANVAVAASRRGAAIALAGGVADDGWGRWLRAALERESIDLRWLMSIAGAPTPLACVTVDSAGEAEYIIYAEGLTRAFAALEPVIDKAVAACDGLFFGSNSLVGSVERAITWRARERALELGRAVLIDANLRLERWPSEREAVAAVMQMVPGARLVRTNRAEARALTGCSDVEEAAERLVGAGAEAVVITLGGAGAVLRGAARADAPGVMATPVSTVGAGDALTGVLVAALAMGGHDPACLAAALPAAVAEGARATERWGAVDPAWT